MIQRRESPGPYQGYHGLRLRGVVCSCFIPKLSLAASGLGSQNNRTPSSCIVHQFDYPAAADL